MEVLSSGSCAVSHVLLCRCVLGLTAVCVEEVHFKCPVTSSSLPLISIQSFAAPITSFSRSSAASSTQRCPSWPRQKPPEKSGRAHLASSSQKSSPVIEINWNSTLVSFIASEFRSIENYGEDDGIWGCVGLKFQCGCVALKTSLCYSSKNVSCKKYFLNHFLFKSIFETTQICFSTSSLMYYVVKLTGPNLGWEAAWRTYLPVCFCLISLNILIWYWYSVQYAIIYYLLPTPLLLLISVTAAKLCHQNISSSHGTVSVGQRITYLYIIDDCWQSH